MYCRAHKTATLTPIQHTVHRGIKHGPPAWQVREVPYRPMALLFWVEQIFNNIYIQYELFLILSPSLFPSAHGRNSILLLVCYVHIIKDQLKEKYYPDSISGT